LGAGGIMTGSKNVITLNINRIIQQGIKVEDVIDRVHKYQIAFNELYKWYKANGLLTIYDAGFIDLDKQYLTLGLNGVVEAAEFLGYTISNNEKYKNWLKHLLGIFKYKNKEASKEYKVKFNTEMVPAENIGVKHAMWDKKDGIKSNRACYNSYFYAVEDDSITIFDKLQLHGGDILEHLDGGSAVHFNNLEHLTAEQYKMLFEYLATSGSNYFCENVPKAVCTNPDCGYIHPNKVDKCPKCGSNVEYATRVIGYLKKVSHFSQARQNEEHDRFYHNKLC
jgi:ribonucleoside-triphosphate reductase